jgi:hypothetical protein
MQRAQSEPNRREQRGESQFFFVDVPRFQVRNVLLEPFLAKIADHSISAM